MERTAAIVFVMSMLVSGASFAGDVSYTYLRLSYVNTEIDAGPVNVDGDGLELDGSFGFVNNAFAFGTYSDLDLDFGVDASLLEIGGGYHHRITPKVDLVGRLGYVRADFDTSFAGGNDDGLLLSGGVRSRINDSIEGRAALNIRTIDAGANDTELDLGGDYYVTDRITVGIGLRLGDDVTTWFLGGRYSFGEQRASMGGQRQASNR
jgi:hypothetical protein